MLGDGDGVVAYSKILSRNSPGETEKIQNVPQRAGKVVWI